MKPCNFRSRGIQRRRRLQRTKVPSIGYIDALNSPKSKQYSAFDKLMNLEPRSSKKVLSALEEFIVTSLSMGLTQDDCLALVQTCKILTEPQSISMSHPMKVGAL